MHIYDDRCLPGCYIVWSGTNILRCQRICSLHEDGQMPLKCQLSTMRPGRALQYSCYNVNQPNTHTVMLQYTQTATRFSPHWPIIHSAQLHKTFCHLQYIELSYVYQCVNYGKGYVHSNWLLQLLCTYTSLTVHISLSIIHALMNVQQFYITEMMKF
jgi:hypothetical protein